MLSMRYLACRVEAPFDDYARDGRAPLKYIATAIQFFSYVDSHSNQVVGCYVYGLCFICGSHVCFGIYNGDNMLS